MKTKMKNAISGRRAALDWWMLKQRDVISSVNIPPAKEMRRRKRRPRSWAEAVSNSYSVSFSPWLPSMSGMDAMEAISEEGFGNSRCWLVGWTDLMSVSSDKIWS